MPIALAILLFFVLSPMVWLLHRARLGPVPAVFLAVALALTVILSVGGLIGMQMSEVIFDIPGYVATIDQKGFRDQTLEILEIALIQRLRLLST